MNPLHAKWLPSPLSSSYGLLWSLEFVVQINLDYGVLYIFASNKSLGQLLNISPKTFLFLKTFDSEFPYIDVWFTDQNSKPLQIEDKIIIILVID